MIFIKYGVNIEILIEWDNTEATPPSISTEGKNGRRMIYNTNNQPGTVVGGRNPQRNPQRNPPEKNLVFCFLSQ